MYQQDFSEPYIPEQPTFYFGIYSEISKTEIRRITAVSIEQAIGRICDFYTKLPGKNSNLLFVHHYEFVLPGAFVSSIREPYLSFLFLAKSKEFEISNAPKEIFRSGASIGGRPILGIEPPFLVKSPSVYTVKDWASRI